MSRIKVGLAAVVGFFVAAQFVPVHRTNPAARGEIEAPGEVTAVLERSCFDCHSNRTKWPWYSRVAPASWFVAHDVGEGREHLNFSYWNEYTAKDRERLAEEAVEEVEKGAMPMKLYVLLHREAGVGAVDLAALRAWAREEASSGERESR